MALPRPIWEYAVPVTQASLQSPPTGGIKLSWFAPKLPGTNTYHWATGYVVCLFIGTEPPEIDLDVPPTSPQYQRYHMSFVTDSYTAVQQNTDLYYTVTVAEPELETGETAYYGIYPTWEYSSGDKATGSMLFLGWSSAGAIPLEPGTGIADTTKWSHNSIIGYVGTDSVQLTAAGVKTDYASVLSKNTIPNTWTRLELQFQLSVYNSSQSVADEFYAGLADESVGTTDSFGTSAYAKWYLNKGTSLYLDWWAVGAATKFAKAKENINPIEDSPSVFEWFNEDVTTKNKKSIISNGNYNYYKIVFEKTNYNSETELYDAEARVYFKANEIEDWTLWSTFVQLNAFKGTGNSYIAFGARTGIFTSTTIFKNVSVVINGEKLEDEKDNSTGDSDTKLPPNTGGSNNKYTWTPVDEDTETIIEVEDPDGNIIGQIPIVGLNPGTVLIIRKVMDRFYLLQDGKIIWTYLLSPKQLYYFTSTAYIGWINPITKEPITTPPEAVVRPTFNSLYYVLDATIIEESYSPQALFNGVKIPIGQTLAIFEDDSFVIDRAISEEELKQAKYIIYSGKSYRLSSKQYGPSPLLPPWVLQLIGSSDYYGYIKEVQVD